MISNNAFILSDFRQLLSEVSIEEMDTKQKELHLAQLSKLLKHRLDVGAETYESEVPIQIEECLAVNRDNLREGIEEVVDALVYLIAQRVLAAINTKNKLEYSYLSKSIHHLAKSLLYAMLADDERNRK